MSTPATVAKEVSALKLVLNDGARKTEVAIELLKLQVGSNQDMVAALEGFAKETDRKHDERTRELDGKISELTKQIALLQQDHERDKKDREKAEGRVWQFAGIAFAAVLTAVVAVLLSLAGLKKP